MRRWLVVLVALLIGCSGRSSGVIYVTLQGNGDEVTVTPVPVEFDSASSFYYRWSPDGRYLVYGEDGDLWLYDASTGDSRNLTATPDRWELMPSWSPDGGRIAFASRPFEPGERGRTRTTMMGCPCGSPTIVRLDGAGYQVLGEGATRNPPSWSPDGTELAFDDQNLVRIYDFRTGRTSGLEPGEIMPQARLIGAPAFSPVRDMMAVFFSEGDQEPSREQVLNGSAPRPRQGYALVDRNTRQVRVVYEYRAPFSFRPPALWSGDGRRIALNLTCQLYLCDPVGLYVADLDSASVERVAQETYQAAWDPVASRLAYIDHMDQHNVKVVTFTASGWRSKTLRQEQSVEGIAWRP